MTEDEAIEEFKSLWISKVPTEHRDEFYIDFVKGIQSGTSLWYKWFDFAWDDEIEQEVRKAWRTENSKLGKALK